MLQVFFPDNMCITTRLMPNKKSLSKYLSTFCNLERAECAALWTAPPATHTHTHKRAHTSAHTAPLPSLMKGNPWKTARISHKAVLNWEFLKFCCWTFQNANIHFVGVRNLPVHNTSVFVGTFLFPLWEMWITASFTSPPPHPSLCLCK